MLDYIIVGQGLAGTWLSYYLHKMGASILVIDNPKKPAATLVAGGIINPVTGRRFTETWMLNELFPFLQKAYSELGEKLGTKLLTKKSALLYFTNAESRLAFQNAVDKKIPHINFSPAVQPTDEIFHAPFGTGQIEPVYIAALDQLTLKWREYLNKNDLYHSTDFEENRLQLQDYGIQYAELRAKRIIFCNGAAAASSSYFDKLPFSLVKGEALILEIPGLSDSYVYKRQFMLSPLPEKNFFWWGGGYEWEFEDDAPSQTFYRAATAALTDWLRLPYLVKEHRAGIRPATFERRPFVGLHPHFPQIGLFNGLGTKGCSLAPYFAHQFANHLLNGTAIQADVSVQRFERVLKREK